MKSFKELPLKKRVSIALLVVLGIGIFLTSSWAIVRVFSAARSYAHSQTGGDSEADGGKETKEADENTPSQREPASAETSMSQGKTTESPFTYTLKDMNVSFSEEKGGRVGLASIAPKLSTPCKKWRWNLNGTILTAGKMWCAFATGLKKRGQKSLERVPLRKLKSTIGF